MQHMQFFLELSVDNITNSTLDKVVITNTIPLTDKAMTCSKIRQLSIAPTLAERYQKN